MEKYGAAAAFTVATGREDEIKMKAITPSIAPLAISLEYQERIYFHNCKGFGVYNYIYLETALRSIPFRIRNSHNAAQQSLGGDELTRPAFYGVHEFFCVVACNEVVRFNLSIVGLRVSAELGSIRTAWVKPAT